MSAQANTAHTDASNPAVNGTGTMDHITKNMSHDEHEAAKQAARFGYGPLAHTGSRSNMLPAFGGEFQPGMYKQVKDRKIANPAPLGLCAFALTTFVLGLINMNTRGLTEPNLVIGIAYGYGGLVQLLAGMWEMAVGNTFGATALSSYGGFWLSFAIILTPGGFEIEETLVNEPTGPWNFYDSFGLYLIGWFIFTTILVLCTLKSTLAFFLLFFSLDMAFMLLGIGYLHRTSMGKPNPPIIKAGGFFALLAAFMAWYNAFAGIADDSNSFFVVPVLHFPWSARGREKRGLGNEKGEKSV